MNFFSPSTRGNISGSISVKTLNERLINYSEEKAKKFEYDLQKLQNEKDIIQKRLEKIELDELKATGPSNKNIEAFKEKYDGVLRKAQDLLFERQKIIKSMELKVEAQNLQVRHKSVPRMVLKCQFMVQIFIFYSVKCR